jgi:hypothetical protein
MAEKGPGFLDGNKLYDWCVTQYQQLPFQNFACTDYIAGVADGLAFNDKFCPSVGVRPVQVVDIVRQYLTSYPERRHYGAASLIADALTAKFPCSN